MENFYIGGTVGILATLIVRTVLSHTWLARPGRSPVVSADDSNALYRALRSLGYTTQSQTADVVELVESWVAGENIEKTVERLREDADA